MRRPWARSGNGPPSVWRRVKPASPHATGTPECSRDLHRAAQVARSCIVVVMTALYVKAHAPLFLVWDAIVLIGLVPSLSVAAPSARVREEHEQVMRLDLPPGRQKTLRRRRVCHRCGCSVR